VDLADPRPAVQCDDRYNWLVTDDQVPHKARILMMLALTGENCARKLQNAFLNY
jgi:glutamin-(asparagin-)ase